MKVWMFYKNCELESVETSGKHKMELYAYTNRKSIRYAFIKSRNPEMFFERIDDMTKDDILKFDMAYEKFGISRFEFSCGINESVFIYATNLEHMDCEGSLRMMGRLKLSNVSTMIDSIYNGRSITQIFSKKICHSLNTLGFNKTVWPYGRNSLAIPGVRVNTFGIFMLYYGDRLR